MHKYFLSSTLYFSWSADFTQRWRQRNSQFIFFIYFLFLPSFSFFILTSLCRLHVFLLFSVFLFFLPSFLFFYSLSVAGQSVSKNQLCDVIKIKDYPSLFYVFSFRLLLSSPSFFWRHIFFETLCSATSFFNFHLSYFSLILTFFLLSSFICLSQCICFYFPLTITTNYE